MITPRFFLQQDEERIHVHIFIKYAKINDIDIEIQDNRFWFYLKPYHLKLSLPGKIVSDSREKCEYDVDKGELIISIGKLVPGEVFSDLDLISKLLEPKRSKNKSGNLIEVIGESAVEADTLLGTGYGFNRKEQGLFTDRLEEMHEIFDVNPDENTLEERHTISKTLENQDWNLDRYFEDLDYEMPEARFNKFYKEFLPSISQRMEELSIDTLVQLGNKSILVHPELVNTMLIQISDIVFCFCYEMRGIGEITCESASNINKISPTLSCLLEFASIEEMLAGCYRRTLIYGLYRNINIAQTAWTDTINLFQEGKAAILRVLAKIRLIFNQSEPRYLLNRLFIDDFIIWIQNCEEINDFYRNMAASMVPSIQSLELNFTFA